MRLACVKHAASVRSEPGSNSQVHLSSRPNPTTNKQNPNTQNQHLTKSSSSAKTSSLQSSTTQARAANNHQQPKRRQHIRPYSIYRCNCQKSTQNQNSQPRPHHMDRDLVWFRFQPAAWREGKNLTEAMSGCQPARRIGEALLKARRRGGQAGIMKFVRNRGTSPRNVGFPMPASSSGDSRHEPRSRSDRRRSPRHRQSDAAHCG